MTEADIFPEISTNNITVKALYFKQVCALSLV